MRQPQQQYHCAPRRLLLPRRRLLLLVCLVWLCAATATSSSRSMRPPFHHHHRVTAAFLLRLPSAQRTLASAASAFAVVSSSVATEAPPPQPTSKQPPKAPPRSIALDTEAGRAVLRRGWGVESAADVKIVSADEWRPAAERHRAGMLTLLGGSTGAHDMKNPIHNFIWEYYHISSKKTLLEYGPGVGDGEPATPTAFLLPTHTHPNTDTDAAADAIRLLAGKAVAVTGLPGVDPREATAVMWVPPPLGSKGFTEKHVKALRFGREVLRASAGRAPIFYCYGVHEWAMLYRPPGAPEPHKYQTLPLRIPQEVLNDYVESKPIRCTHYDAFRFFTPEARPLNVYAADLAKRQPGQVMHEQPGCLHAGMDLFKWASKLGPYAPSSLVEEALRLAIQCRVLDMRASPYDLRALDPSVGFGHPVDPVRIETEEGRREYALLQQQLYEASLPLRRRVLEAYDRFFALVERGG